MKKILSIAGSDPSGGAGIQADLKTFCAHHHYGMSVISALTAQNTMGVYAIHDIPAEFFDQQLCAVLDDIHPDAVKIGMLGNVEIINIIAKRLQEYHIQNIVLDPVMVSTSGFSLCKDEVLSTLIEVLFPLASIITPNLAEAEVLAGMKIETVQQQLLGAKKIAQYYHGAILIKGGHLLGEANDLFYSAKETSLLHGKRIDNANTHGTGCTLSSAIACRLGEGYSMVESVQLAKTYVTTCIEAQMDIGKGRGPLDHLCQLNQNFMDKEYTS